MLLIETNKQGDLTTCLGLRDTDNLGITLATKLTDVISETMTDPIYGILHHEEGVDLLPANLELSAMEYNLMNAMSRETTLRNYLSQVKDRYNFVLISCYINKNDDEKPKYKVSDKDIDGYEHLGRLVVTMRNYEV